MMTTKNPTVTRRQAEACLAAVKKQFRSYLEPMDCIAITDEDGREWPATTYPPLCPPPTLNMDWEGHVAILWEDGPDEWAHRATAGGSSEEDRVLMAQANQEFGGNLKVREDDPIAWPRGVIAEPYFSFVLCLYPA